MRILVAIDEKPYSAHAVSEVARLAANTWANVILLGVQAKIAPPGAASRDWPTSHPLPSAVRTYRETFLKHFKEDECPYVQREFGYELIEVRKGVWEELYVAKSARKDLKTLIRIGNPVKEILAEAEEEQIDLIVLGCDNARGCEWEEPSGVPQKVVNNATCSVLVAKEEKEVNRIVCCLDHDLVSQQSLEMINQLVTLHKAKLEIVGLTEAEELKVEVEKKMDAILRYYTARGLEPWIEIVELDSFDAFISQGAKWGLMALWMGKKSILEKVFPKGKVAKLIKGSDSSVLILR
ncbi:MAG: universal stress protein [Deltaproteobacteria bacterium]|nr:universal stress protein [Deltaproteobacteria bacterium]